MGVRPPTNDDTDEPDTVTFGIAALDAQLNGVDLSYPVDAEEVVTALGDPQIPYDATGNDVRLSDALERTRVDRFDTEQELLNALHPVFESYRERTSNSFIAQLRALFPF